MSISKDVINWLNSTEIPISIISKKTGISRQTLYKWISYKKSDSKFVIQNNKLTKVYNMYSEYIFKKKNSGGLTVSQQNMLIEYQQKEIADLKKRVANHRATPIQETVWNQLDFDFEAKVKLTFENFTMGRTILSISNIEIQSKILGYSLSELKNIYDINAHHKSSQKHPVDALLNTKTLKDIKHQIKSLPSLFESLKNMMGNHYIPQPLTYVCKNKSLINAIAYNKVNWKEKTVNSKIKFLLND